MKAILIIALACVASAAALGGFQKATTYNGLKRQILNNVYAQAGVRSDVIDIEDPLHLNDTTLELTEDIFTGIVTLVGGTATGGSGLVDDVAVNLLTLKLTISIDLPAGRLTGAYTIAGEAIGEDGVHHVVQGAGEIDASIAGFKLDATATLAVNLISNRASIKNLDTQALEFASVQLSATGATVDNEPVDWEAVTADAKAEFDRIYAANKTTILQKITDAINEVLGQYTLAELIDLINGGSKAARLH